MRRTRQSSDSTVSELLREATLVCIHCDEPFPYRYRGIWHERTLMPVDRVCRTCLPVWYASWARAAGWL